MAPLICSANPVPNTASMAAAIAGKTRQHAGTEGFPESHPRELLVRQSPLKLKKRAANLCKITGLCDRSWKAVPPEQRIPSLDIVNYADKASDLMRLPIVRMAHGGSRQLIIDLFTSNTVRDEELVALFQTVARGEGFAAEAHQLFLKHGQFFWEWFPLNVVGGGSIGFCFVPQT